MENEFILAAAAGIQPHSMADMQAWHCPPPDTLFHPNGWDVPAFNPAGSSPHHVSDDSVLLRELIGKLGGFGGNPGGSCYGPPLSSPQNFWKPFEVGAIDDFADFAADPGFVERAARLSCFGSRSFNGRTGLYAGVEFDQGRLAEGGVVAAGEVKLGRVSSSPLLNGLGPGMEIGGSPRQLDGINSMESPEEESSVIEQVPSAETGQRGSGETNSRKRKGIGKAKATGNGNTRAKRCKSEEDAEDEGKPPPKDYIHVRARRGQATDSHSLAERVRREKISERMKLLQDLVPGCNKVTGKALMLDEIINYVHSLQRQVQFLSMKLATVDTSRGVNDALPHRLYPGEAASTAASSNIHDHQRHNRTLDSHLSPPGDVQCGGFGSGGDELHTVVQMGLGQSSLTTSFPSPHY